MTDRPTDILVVDDDPDLLEVVRVILTMSGYEVRCASNGKEAIERVEEKVPALILLDMLMPVMDGWQCASELQARYGRSLPIVVITAAEHARARAEKVGSGVNGVLAKPFDMDDLLRMVSRYASKKAA